MKTRRLGIFVFYDQDGIVGNYVYYLLDEISQWVHHLVIVCNGKLSAEGSERFHQYTEDVFVRENSGYDGTAYKEVILNLYGIDKVREFDELLLFNDSCYAPMYPFEAVFDKMESDDIDFWGITEYESVSNHIAKHIQAYFICIHSRMLHSPEFREFWNTMEPIYEYEDAVRHFEIKFTTYFSENGYHWRTLIGESPYILYYDGYEMMKYHHCPFVKRKNYTSFAEGALLRGGNV
ncbi:MAG: rhamnan synthesis F family protein, partial [Hungatella sp.]